MLHKWENNPVLRVRKAKRQFLVFVSLTVIGGSLPLITNIGTSRAATTSATTSSATDEGNSVPSSSSDSGSATTNTTYEPTQVTIPSATDPTSSPSHQLSIEAVSSNLITKSQPSRITKTLRIIMTVCWETSYHRKI